MLLEKRKEKEQAWMGENKHMKAKPLQILLRDYDIEALNYLLDHYEKAGGVYVNVSKASIIRGLITEKYNQLTKK